MDLIDQFIAEKIKPQFRPIYERFRALVKADFSSVQEEMRGGTEKYYAVPVYRYRKIIITVSPTQKGIAFSQGKRWKISLED